VDEFLRQWPCNFRELAAMMDVALASFRSAPGIEMVWTGPSVGAVPGRRTEQVLLELIQSAQQQLTVMSFGVFQVERVVYTLESALNRGVRVRIVLGDRDSSHDQDIQYQRLQLGPVIASGASLFFWPPERRPRDSEGRAGLMHAKAALADSKLAFLSSANLTEAALERNMELGVLIRGGNLPSSIDRLVDALCESGGLQAM
jgi:phosphatidylserine/phosphatidylglycerophosphate/cardiolipin synthase-like enzyme